MVTGGTGSFGNKFAEIVLNEHDPEVIRIFSRGEKKQLDMMNKFNDKTQEINQKLNRLLDAYLDQVIEPKIYKEKKNELFEQKLKIQEKIAKIQKDGSCWLEPMNEFLKSAVSAHKIARAKENSHLLAQMAKKVGSNYSLMNRRLSATLKFPHMALSAGAGATSAPPNKNSISLMVTAGGLELPTSTTCPPSLCEPDWTRTSDLYDVNVAL